MRGKILEEHLRWEILLWPSLESMGFNCIFIQALSRQIIFIRILLESYQKFIQDEGELLNLS